MKIYVLAPNENWVCDRFHKEWSENNSTKITYDPREADIIWLLGSWCWKKIPIDLLKTKKVITTIHHIVPEKFSLEKQKDFRERDAITDCYHVPSRKTKEQIEKITEKKIYDFPFWVNQNLWKKIDDKSSLREKYGISKNEFVIGSFQRDTEGHDLKSPKLEKGPDLFCEAVSSMRSNFQNLTVLLAGWRRQYVIGRLEEMKIPYRYFELPDFTTLNELYNCLNLYMVTSRYEGGPQSILECASNKTPIVSTDVGIASEILSPDSILQNEKNMSTDVDYAYEKVSKLFMPTGFDPFLKMFSEVVNEKIET